MFTAKDQTKDDYRKENLKKMLTCGLGSVIMCATVENQQETYEPFTSAQTEESPRR